MLNLSLGCREWLSKENTLGGGHVVFLMYSPGSCGVSFSFMCDCCSLPEDISGFSPGPLSSSWRERKAGKTVCRKTSPPVNLTL